MMDLDEPDERPRPRARASLPWRFLFVIAAWFVIASLALAILAVALDGCGGVSIHAPKP